MRLVLTILIATFVVQLRAQWPDELPLPDLWVRGDSALELSGNRVVTWPDLSPNENHLTQSVNNWRPTVLPEELNTHTVVSFNGVNSRMLFNEITTIRTVFWVVRRPDNIGTTRRPILGHSATFDFFRGPDQRLWDTEFTSPNVLSGTSRMGFNNINGTATPIPENTWQIVSVVTTGDVQASQLGQDRSTNNFWWGEFAEMIIFSTALTSEEVLLLENYLADYYTNPLDLGDDVVVTEGVCPTVLDIGEGFTDIGWSTGATTPSIEVNTTGTYWVQAKDLFGRVVSDTINVSYPGNLNYQTLVTICAGDAFAVDLELDDLQYTTVWSDGQAGSAVEFDTAGGFSATVTDAESCTLITPTIEVVIDNFETEASLGDDLELCAGNSIGLSFNGTLESILWMDEFDSEELVISITGEYFVEAVNANGCFMQDTVFVTIVGQAPEVVINQPGTFCLNTEGALQASIAADAPIASIEWVLPSGVPADEQIIAWVPEQTGPAEIGVTVTTEVGCSTSTVTQTIVFPLPEGQINVGSACSLLEFTLNASLSIESGTIASVDWVFEEQGYFGTPSVVVPQNAGFQEVTLTLTSNMGCVSTYQQLVNVRQSPVVQGAAEATCVGSLTGFSTEVLEPGQGGIAGWQWFFGDNTTSTQQNPQHLYPTQGTYSAVVQAVAATGCVGLDTVEVEIIPLPNPDFAVTNACLEVPYAIQNQSTSQDPIESYVWTVNGQDVYTGSNPEVLFGTLGFNSVELYAETDRGCSNTISKMIPVFALPVPDFTPNPPIGLPPLLVSFENASQGGLTYLWQFTNDDFSEDAAPQFTFTEEGSYPVELTVTNEFGCSSSITREVDATEPILDIAIDGLNLQPTATGYEISALVVNVGNVTADAIELSAAHGNGTTITENLDAPLAPGASVLYTWSARLQPTQAAYPYFCVSAIPRSELADERTPENNRRCQTDESGFELTPVFPNPVSAGGTFVVRVILPEAEKVNIQLIDTRGALALQTEELTLRQGFNEITLSSGALNAGQYTLVLIGERHTAHQQVQVMRQ